MSRRVFSAFVSPTTVPVIVESPCDAVCPLPHFTRDGRPRDVRAFRYVEYGGQNRRAIVCRAHIPDWVAGLPAAAIRR